MLRMLPAWTKHVVVASVTGCLIERKNETLLSNEFTRSSIFSMQPPHQTGTLNLPALRGSSSRADSVAFNYFVWRWRDQGLSFGASDGVYTVRRKDPQTGEYRAGRGFTLAVDLVGSS